MRLHQNERAPEHAEFFSRRAQELEKVESISVVAEDPALAIPSRHHVVNRTWVGESGSACHAALSSKIRAVAKSLLSGAIGEIAGEGVADSATIIGSSQSKSCDALVTCP
jgi:hypothetical protein